MGAKENKEVVRRMNEAFNTGDSDIVDSLFHTKHVDRTPFPGTGKTRDGLKQQIKALRKAFPDARFTITDMVAEGNTVSFWWKMEGTNRGAFLGNAPTELSISHVGSDIVTFSDDGKIIGHKSADNLPALFGKLGLQVDLAVLHKDHDV